MDFEDRDFLLRQFVTSVIDCHPTPWRVEQDWTWEVTDAYGYVVMKCMTEAQARALVDLADDVVRERNTESEPARKEPTYEQALVVSKTLAARYGHETWWNGLSVHNSQYRGYYVEIRVRADFDRLARELPLCRDGVAIEVRQAKAQEPK